MNDTELGPSLNEISASVEAMITATDWPAATNELLKETFGDIVTGLPRAVSQWGVQYDLLSTFVNYDTEAQNRLISHAADLELRIFDTITNFCFGLLRGKPAIDYRLVWRTPPAVDHITVRRAAKIWTRACVVPLTAATDPRWDGTEDDQQLRH